MQELKDIKEEVKLENELINHRLTWLGTFQGLLFTALAFAWDKQDTWLLILVLCTLGVFVSCSIGLATYRANKVIDKLDLEWDRIKPTDYSGLDVEGVRSSSGIFPLLMPGYFIPWLFFACWLIIGVFRLFLDMQEPAGRILLV